MTWLKGLYLSYDHHGTASRKLLLIASGCLTLG
jgi:hypothetical protein